VEQVTGQKKKGRRKGNKCPNWGKWVWPDESWSHCALRNYKP